MQESMKGIYDEKYYQRRKYEFESRYPYLSALAKTLVEEFNPKSVLDVGCAKGYLVYAFRHLGVEAYGVDISEYAISQSPGEIRDALFNIDVDSQRLPFEDDTFDLVTAPEVIEHLQNHDHLLSEIRRALKPKGIVFMATPTRRWLDVFLTLIGAGGYGRFGRNPSHVNIHSRSFWISTFESYGFYHIGDFPRQQHKKAFSLCPPASRIARFMVRFGGIGKWVRDQLAFAVRTDTFLFRLE